MTLSDLVQEYRREHGLSQRQFASICGLSNGYISMLERNVNPKTGQPVTPSLPALKKIADGMSITLTDLFTRTDDIPVDLLTEGLDETTPAPKAGSGRSGLDIELAAFLLELTPEKKREALSYLRYLAESADK